MNYIALLALIMSSIALAIVTPTSQTVDTFIPTCCSVDGCEPDQRVQLSGTYRDPGSAAKACLVELTTKVHHIDASSTTISNTIEANPGQHQLLSN